jgi:hypothetical protein
MAARTDALKRVGDLEAANCGLLAQITALEDDRAALQSQLRAAEEELAGVRRALAQSDDARGRPVLKLPNQQFYPFVLFLIDTFWFGLVWFVFVFVHSDRSDGHVAPYERVPSARCNAMLTAHSYASRNCVDASIS